MCESKQLNGTDPDIDMVDVRRKSFNLMSFFPANFKAGEKEEVLFYLLKRAGSDLYSRFLMQSELLLVCMSRCLFARSSFPDMHGKHTFCQCEH